MRPGDLKRLQAAVFRKVAKSMRLKFFKQSAEKFVSRIDPANEVQRDSEIAK
jgi:hypothetical protein